MQGCRVKRPVWRQRGAPDSIRNSTVEPGRPAPECFPGAVEPGVKLRVHCRSHQPSEWLEDTWMCMPRVLFSHRRRREVCRGDSMMSLEDVLSSMLFLYCKILWLPETQLSGLWGHLLLSSTAQPLPSNAHSGAYTSGFPAPPASGNCISPGSFCGVCFLKNTSINTLTVHINESHREVSTCTHAVL